MRFFNNVPWKAWKTRKIAFVSVCLVWLIYAILGMFKVEVDTLFLEFILDGGKFILGAGTALVTTDKVAELLLKFIYKDKEEQ